MHCFANLWRFFLGERGPGRLGARRGDLGGQAGFGRLREENETFERTTGDSRIWDVGFLQFQWCSMTDEDPRAVGNESGGGAKKRKKKKKSASSLQTWDNKTTFSKWPRGRKSANVVGEIRGGRERESGHGAVVEDTTGDSVRDLSEGTTGFNGTDRLGPAFFAGGRPGGRGGDSSLGMREAANGRIRFVLFTGGNRGLDGSFATWKTAPCGDGQSLGKIWC